MDHQAINLQAKVRLTRASAGLATAWHLIQVAGDIGKFIQSTLRKLLIVLVSLAAASASASDYKIDRRQSVFAVVTHRAGFAAALAHNHVIAPSSYKAALSGEVSAEPDGRLTLSKPRFRLSFAVADLEPDAPDLQETLFPQLKAADILEDALRPIKESDRIAIAKTMLSPEQLDEAQFPAIIAELKSLELEPATLGVSSFTHRALIELSIHGHTVASPFAVRLAKRDGQIRLEGVGSYHFTDFGIKPYSAFGGAVRNEDLFHIYVQFVAER